MDSMKTIMSNILIEQSGGIKDTFKRYGVKVSRLLKRIEWTLTKTYHNTEERTPAGVKALVTGLSDKELKETWDVFDTLGVMMNGGTEDPISRLTFDLVVREMKKRKLGKWRES